MDAAIERLAEHLGPPCFTSGGLPFAWTDYYGAELGQDPSRRLIAFEDPVDPARLAEIKRFTCRLEVAMSRPGGRATRQVNIDPGLLNESQVVVASTKPRAHRIYLGQGVYGDLMLIWRQGGYAPLEWTYPDYAEAQLRDLFDKLRELHLARRRMRSGAMP